MCTSIGNAKHDQILWYLPKDMPCNQYIKNRDMNNEPFTANKKADH